MEGKRAQTYKRSCFKITRQTTSKNMKQKTDSLDPHQYPQTNLYLNNAKIEAKNKIPAHPKASSNVLKTQKWICKRKQEMKTKEGWHDYGVLIRKDISQGPWCTTRQQEVTFGVRAMLICKLGSISLSELRDRLSQSSREGSHYPCREQEIRIF